MDIIDEYDDAAEAIGIKVHVLSNTEAVEEMSDDFGSQLLSDCIEVCRIYGVPREDRIDLICECIRKELYSSMDQEIKSLRMSLQRMSGL